MFAQVVEMLWKCQPKTESRYSLIAPTVVLTCEVERMTNYEYEKLQAELSQLLNTEKYKRMTSKNKEIYRQAVLACKSVVSHYEEREVEE